MSGDLSEAGRINKLTRNRGFFLVTRIVFGLFFLISSSYCLLAYIPFTYQWVIKCTLVKWLPVFVNLHPLLYWTVLALVTLTLVSERRRKHSRRLAGGFVVFHIVGGVALSFRPLLSNLANDERSFYYSLILLFPLVWLAAIDYAGNARRVRWSKNDEEHLAISTVVLAGSFLALLYAGLFYVRFSVDDGARLRRSELIVVISWSLASHLMVFIVGFLAFRLVRSLTSRLKHGSKIEFLICNILFIVVLAVLLRRMVLPALTFNGNRADVFSVAVALALVSLVGGLSVRLYTETKREITSGFVLTLAPLLVFSPRRDSSRLLRFVWIGLIATVACAIPLMIATRDWDFLMQKLGVVVVWIATFGFFYAQQRGQRRRSYSLPGLLLIAVVSTGWYTVLGSSESLWPALLRDEQLSVSSTLERYSSYDVSFRLARDILRPDLHLFRSASANPVDGDSSGSADGSFFGFLQQNTNLLPSVKVVPPDFTLAGELVPSEGQKPNIFLFVVDSLRQDYLSTYNRAVDFTPNIDRFARDSVVLSNAFTRYGGTVLAEPSIWTGTLQLHKQYIEPFYPMNSLQKLIEVEGYESFITIDPVVRIVTKPSPDVNELDKDNLWFEYDFCRTLTELRTKIDERQTPSRPMFVYTQPQNLHRVVLKDKGDPVPAGERYPGFFAPYASQVRHIDACFGEFIEFLKSRGLYDNSIVILSSDHGDSLGEQGRWGHSYWMSPEILRVPLIIRVPAELRKGHTWNSKSIAFTTDITPTLYYLLGHRPVERNQIFGRPLITATEKEQTDYLHKNYLVVSSYGPVYGVLGGDGRSLFIADAVNQKEYFFNLADDPNGARNRLTEGIRSENESLIRELIGSVNRFYGLGEYP
jgi:hypothetical protein